MPATIMHRTCGRSNRRGLTPTAESFCDSTVVVQTTGANTRIIPELRATLRESDTVARLAGDRFGILPAGDTAPEDQTALIRSLLEGLQIPETPEEIAAELSAHDHVVE